MSTIQSWSSSTIIPPDPIILPSATNVSKSTSWVKCFSVKQPPLGPPVNTALNFLLFPTPRPISWIISPKVIPIGTSISPVFFIFPASANTLVPGDLSVPKDLNHLLPFNIICEILANVSTLLIIVGLPYKPSIAG